jgi:thiopeptide-type bacteriocin biosynthesis protein
MSETRPAWLSIYLDLAHSGTGWEEVYGSLADEVLTGLVRPLLDDLLGRGVVRRFFFIRYRDPGAHVRLRLLAPVGEHAGIVAGLEGARREFNESRKGPPVLTGLRPEAYRPEVSRYGGPLGVGISEAVFETSSVLVLDTLPAIVRAGGEGALRFGHAGMGAMLLVGALLRGESTATKIRFLEQYEGTQLDRFVKGEAAARMKGRLEALAGGQDSLMDKLQAVHQAAEEPERLPEPLSGAATGFLSVRRELVDACERGAIRFNGNRGDRAPSLSRALRTLAYSYLHMHLNRLGVGTIHEPLVARIARRTLERAERAGAWT